MICFSENAKELSKNSEDKDDDNQHQGGGTTEDSTEISIDTENGGTLILDAICISADIQLFNKHFKWRNNETNNLKK